MNTRTLRGVGVFAALAVAGGGLAACSGSSANAGSNSGSSIDIAYSVDVLDSTQNAFLEAMKAEVAAINTGSSAVKVKAGVKVKLTTTDAQSSVDKQLSDVQTALVKHPNVLILSAVDPKGSLPAAQQAKAAGVKVIDKRPSDPEPSVYDVAFYSNDEARYSAATKKWIMGYLAAHPSVTLKVGLIYGAPAQTAQLVRENVIKDLAKQMPDRIKIVASGYGNWLTATAQNLAQDWIQAHPDINYISAANDIMALGAANAIKAHGKSGSILLSGYDLTSDGVQRLKAGQQAFDTGVSISDGGKQLIDTAVKLAQGKLTQKKVYTNPVYAVTPENVNSIAALK
ncbi:sugar ABC transporter substrate-binding protein [Streptomyces sp. NPDC002276]